jgi:hypothetical protein
VERKKLIVQDILEVIYAPKKAFKSIIANPKYLGAILVLIIFMGVQVGFQYTQFSKTYAEDTSLSHYPTFLNVTSGDWQGTSGVSFTNNYNDFFNYTIFTATPQGYMLVPRIFGNSSVQISAENTGNLSVALSNAFNVDCGSSGYRNLTMVIKQVSPSSVPQKVTLSLYSLNDADFYQYDLTNSMSNTSLIGQWNNLTIPVGASAAGWTATGSPTWSNVTSLKMDFVYPANSNVTLNLGSLFFRGHYLSFTEYDSTGVLLLVLQAFSLQFLLEWILITGILFLLLKGLKTSVMWKPMFIAVGFALFVMVIRALINLAATLTLPAVYYPFDLSGGVGFTPYGTLAFPPQFIGIAFADSQAAFHSIESLTAAFRAINIGTLALGYLWLGALCGIILGEVKPEFSLMKRLALSAVAVGITIAVLIFLVVGIA